MTTLSILKTYFYIEQDSVDINDNLKYKKYSDLSNLNNDELWAHANQYGYKEQRQIFYDCSYNESFYNLYLSTYRDAVLNVNPSFDWLVYSKSCQLTIKSEYYALLHYIENNNIDINAVISSTTDSNNVYVYNKLHYSIIAECGTYDYQTFPYAYGAGQWSSENFGIIVPYDSTLLRGYLMYYYEDFDNYNTSAIRDNYIYNDTKIKIKLDLYINGSLSDYYIEETLDPSKNMMGVLYKYRKEENNLTHNIDYNTIYLQENTIISWYCTELIGTDLSGNYTNYPYNPARNRLINLLEPSNNFVVSDSISSNINIDSKMNSYSTNAVQNKVITNKFSLIDSSVNLLDSSMGNIYQLVNLLDTSINQLETKTDYSFNNVDISNELYIKNLNVYDKLIDLSNNGTGSSSSSIDDITGLQSALDSKQATLTSSTNLNVNTITCSNIQPTNINGYAAITTVAIVKYNGIIQNTDRAVGCSITRNSTGKYTCTFTNALPDSTYVVNATLVESTTDRDDMIVTIDLYSASNTDFQLTITEKDNGTSAGTLTDAVFFLSVFY